NKSLSLFVVVALVNKAGNAMAALGRNLTFGEAAQIDSTPFGPNDTIQFNLSVPQIRAGVMDLTAPVTIIGPGAGLLSIASPTALFVFSVASNVTARISGLTITGNSDSTSAGIDNRGTLALFDVTVKGFSSGTSGGGIENEATGTLTIDSSTIANNRALGLGGGIDNQGTLTVARSTIASNVGGFSLFVRL